MMLVHDARLHGDASALAAVLFPPLVATGLTVQAGMDLLPLTQLFFVLPAPLLMAALFSREWEGGTADTLLARPAARSLLLLSRLAVATAFLLLALLFGWSVLALRGAELALGETLAAALPGALALGAIGLAIATATRVSAAGYLVPLAWWLMDWLTRGRFTGRLYLFGDLDSTKWWLLGLAAAAVASTALMLSRRDR